MTKSMFRKWVCERCAECSENDYTVVVLKDHATVMAISKDGSKIGKAKCHAGDRFDEKIGTAIAYTRAIGEKVPTVRERVNIDILKYGDKFTYDSITYIYIGKNPTKGTHIAVEIKYGFVREAPPKIMVEKF